MGSNAGCSPFLLNTEPQTHYKGLLHKWLKAQKPLPRPLLQEQPALLQMSHIAQIFCSEVTAAWTYMGAALAAHKMLLQGAACISLGRMEFGLGHKAG